MARNILTPEEQYAAEQLLGLAGSYDKKTLKKAYTRMIREWHPDLAQHNGHTEDEANRVTAQVNNAFVALTGLFNDGVTVVSCAPAPSTSASSGTQARQTSQTRQTAGTDAGTAATGSTRRAATARTHADAPDVETEIPDFAPEGSYKATYRRGEVPRNMAAAMRYTRIVTDSSYIRWFVAGIGPHIVWALACLAVLALLGLCMGGVFGPGSILMWVQLLPIAIVYDVATGKGVEIVGSVADIWAVNKAVNGTD